MFVHLLCVGLGVSVAGDLVRLLFIGGRVHEHDLSLQFLIVPLECVLLAEGLLDGDDEFPAEFVLLVQIGDFVDAAIVVVALVHVLVIVGGAVVARRLPDRLHLRGVLGLGVHVGGLG